MAGSSAVRRRVFAAFLFLFTVLLVGVLVAATAAEPGGPKAQAADGANRAFSPSGDSMHEIASRRTANSRTFARPDGLLETKVSSARVNFRDKSGHWKPVNPRWTQTSSGWTNAANSFDLDVPRSLKTGAVEIGDGRTNSMSFGVSGASDSPGQAIGTVAQYSDAFDGVDIKFESKSEKIKESIILRHPDAIREFEFPLSLSAGLTPFREKSGAIVVKDASGKRRFSIAAPWMIDAAGVESRRVEYDLVESGGGWLLSLRASKHWLSDPDRRWPVTIDPTVSVGTEPVCELVSGSSAGTSDCGGFALPFALGKDGSGDTHRALAYLPLRNYVGSDLFTDSIVVYAGLTAEYTAAGDTSPLSVDLHELAEPFDFDASWNKRNSTDSWTTAGGDFNSVRESRAEIPNALVSEPVSFGAGRLVQGWLDGSLDNNGLLLKAANESTSRLDTFKSVDATVITKPHTVGLASRYGYEHQSFTGGAIDVNLANGNVTVTGDAGAIGSSPGSFGVARYWDSALGGDAPPTIGKGWRSWIAGSVALHPNPDDSFFVETPTGHTVLFHKTPTDTWETDDESGLELSKSVSESEYFLDDDGTRYVFDDPETERDTFPLVRVETSGQDFELSNSEGLVQSVEGTSSGLAELNYDDDDLLESVEFDSEDEWHYIRDNRDRLNRVVGPESERTSYVYDGEDRIVQINVGDEETIKIIWDLNGRLASIIRDAGGTEERETKFAFDLPTGVCDVPDATGMTVVSKPDGSKSTYCSDGRLAVIDQIDELAPPSASERPSITGDSTAGQQVTADPGTWIGSAPITYDYQWQLCTGEDSGCSDLTGETADTLTLESGWIGSFVRVRVTATNSEDDATETSDSSMVFGAGDRTPTLELSGELADLDGGWVTAEESLDLDIDAESGDYFNLDHIRAVLDGNSVQTWEGCDTTLPCSQEETLTLQSGDLDEGVHELKVTVIDEDGRTDEEIIPIKVDLTAPEAPQNVSVSDDDGTILTWAAPEDGDDVASYNIYRRDLGTGPFTQIATDVVGTSYEDSSPVTGLGEYYAEAVAESDLTSDQSDIAAIDSGESPDAAPEDLFAESGPETVDLTWSAASGYPRGYALYRSEGEGDPERLTTVSITDADYQDDTTEVGTKYSYRVRAISADGRMGEMSAPVVGRATSDDEPVEPTILLSGGLWDSQGGVASGVEGLDVYAAEGEDPDFPVAGVTEAVVKVDGTTVDSWAEPCPEHNCAIDETTSIDTDALSEGRHVVEVTATDARDRSSVESFSFNTDQGPPSQINELYAYAEGGSLDLEWFEPTDADIAAYDLSGSPESSGPLDHLGDIPSGTDRFETTCADVCRYEVTAVDAAGNRGDSSDTLTVDTQDPPPDAPVLTATPSTNSVDLDWTDESAEAYLVYRRTSEASPWKRLGAGPIDALTYDDTTVLPGETYYYSVRSVNEDNRLSERSNTEDPTTSHHANVPHIDLGGLLPSNQATWLASGTYGLSIAADEDGGVSAPGITSLSVSVDGDKVWSDEQACPGGGCGMSGSWAFDVADYDDGQHAVTVSATNAVKETTTETLAIYTDRDGAPGAPEEPELAAGDGGVTVTWSANPESDIEEYEVWGGTGTASLSLLDTVSAESPLVYNDDTATAANRYRYAIRAADKNAGMSEFSPEVEVLVGASASAAVEGLDAADKHFAVRLDWDATVAPDLAGYAVMRRLENEDKFKSIARTDPGATSYVDDSLEPEESADYRVVTVDESGTHGPAGDIVSGAALAESEAGGDRPLLVVKPALPDKGDHMNAFYVGDGSTEPIDAERVPCAGGTLQDSCEGLSEPVGSAPALSPDGQTIAFVPGGSFTGWQTDSTAIAVKDVDTGTLDPVCSECWDVQEMPNEQFATQMLAFTPDGESIVFVTYNHLTYRSTIHEVNIETGEPEVVRESDLKWVYALTVAPSGNIWLSGEGEFGTETFCGVIKVAPNGASSQRVTPPDGARLCSAIPLPGEDGIVWNNGWEDPYAERAESYVWYFDQKHSRLAAASVRDTPDDWTANWGALSTSGDGESLMVARGRAGAAVRPSMHSTVAADLTTGRPRTVTDKFDTALDGSEATYEAGYAQPEAAIGVQLDSDLADYQKGSGVVTLSGEANGRNTDVEDLEIFMGGESLNVGLDGASFDAAVDLGDLGEGKRRLRIAAYGEDGLINRSTRMVTVDRTAPIIPSEASVAVASGKATVAWDKVHDPELADGSEGSGVASVSYRYAKSDGGWSSVRTTSSNSFSTTADVASLEVRAADNAGNEIRRFVPVAGPEDLEDCPKGRAPCKPWSRRDGRKASNYAMKWAKKTNVIKYGYRVTADCTNFASQALKAGGMELTGEFRFKSSSWYGSVRRKSRSWNVTADLAGHGRESGRMVSYFRLDPRKWREGDIVVYNFNDGKSKFDHASVVTKFVRSGPTISQHGKDRVAFPWVDQRDKVLNNDHPGWEYSVLRSLYKATNVPLPGAG